MFISLPRAAKALLFLPNGVLSATAPAPIVCISVRRETVSIARPSGAPDLRRPTDIATLYHADSTRTLHGFRLDPARQSGNILEATRLRPVRHQMSALGQKRTSRHLQSMSALPPKSDISRCGKDRCYSNHFVSAL